MVDSVGGAWEKEKNIGVKKTILSKKKLGSRKILVQKQILGHKKIKVKKILSLKN